jgi:Fis family transcriptional regulator
MNNQKPSMIEEDGTSRTLSPDEALMIAIHRYLDHLNNCGLTLTYNRIINIVEPAILEHVLCSCNLNKSEASRILGLNRGTLRKKMKKYGFINCA